MTECGWCGDSIHLVVLDDTGTYVPADAGQADAVWINDDEESMCLPHGTADDYDDEDAVCDACHTGEGHDHEPVDVG